MKPYVERRLPAVEAIQWFKHGDVPGLAVDPDNPDNAVIDLDTLWTLDILEPGDYYVEHRGGSIYSVPKERFERTYIEYVE